MNITINLITNLQETVPNTVLTKILTVKRNGGVVNLTGKAKYGQLHNRIK